MKVKLIPLLFALLLTSCSENQLVLNDKIFCFATQIDITLYQGNSDNIKDIKDILEKYDKLTDNYTPRGINNVYAINQTNDYVSIDSDLLDCIEIAQDVTSQGAQYFNLLCGSLSKKWKESLSNGEILSQTVIEEELEKMNNTTLSFTTDSIKRDGEAEIDLGGIAKGYALDIVKDYLDEKGISQYLVNGGFSSILLGEKYNGDGNFIIKMKDLTNTYFKAKNCFVSTSSISNQGVKIGETTYSHIINPITGSAINENDAVIVISDSGYLGDALSTSMMMNTVEEIKQIEIEQNVKTIVIKNNNVIYSNKDIEVFNR
jgi:thiamine biosynthesis lipoprotein